MIKKNLLLSTAIIIVKLLCSFQVIIFVVVTIVLFHLHINPEYYNGTNLAGFFPTQTILGYTVTTKWITSSFEPAEQVFAINNIKKVSLYFFYIHLSAALLFVFLALKEFLKVITSVKRFQTFRTTNITAFGKIGKYLFIVFLLSSFSILEAEHGSFRGLYINLTVLILMLIAFIMAEIFKEGNNLSEDNKLTI